MHNFSLSLKSKLTAIVLLLFLCSISLLAFLIEKRLEHNMINTIEKQQFTAASYIADIIENQVKLHINSLNAIATLITPELIENPVKLKEYLRSNRLLSSFFQTGVVVISKKGKGIVDYPSLPGRSNASYIEMEYFQEVVATKKPTVGKPRIGRFSNKPIISFAVPILSSTGELTAVLVGFTLLSDPILLGTFKNSIYKDFPDGLLLSSPKYHMHIIGSDATRNMTPTPETGRNPLFDRFMTGYEGSGNTVNIRGTRIFLSAKQIPSAGWFVRVGMPTEMAFAPIREMKSFVYFVAFGLALISCLVAWIIIRQALKPVSAASELILKIAKRELPLHNIPIIEHNEIGQLLTSFNTLINDRKQAEEKLREITRRLQLATSSAKAGVWDWNLQTKEMIWDDRMLELYGLTHENFHGGVEAWEQGLHPDDYSRAIEECQAALRGERDFDTEFRVLRPDGTVIYIKANGIVLCDEEGKPSQMIGLNIDITDRKKAEELLRESEASYRQLFENAPSAIYRVDFRNGKFVKVNDVLREYLGYSYEEILSLSPYDILTEESKKLFLERMRKMSLGEKVPETVEYEIVDKNGKKIFLHLNNKMIYDAEGHAVASDVVAHDITDRKRAEEEKQALEERLQRAEKMEALGLLAGGVAHDLNNVLGIVVGYAEMVLGDIDEKNPIREDLQSIMEGGQKAAAIVQDLLTLARRGVTGRKVINVNRLILDFNKSPEWENIHANHTSVQIKTDLETDLLNISASPVHIQKTLMNLVSNASEAMPKGGKISIKTTNQYLDKPISGYDNIREGDYVVLSVSDTGEGISESDLKRIFEPFYTKKIMGRSGTGLGLAVVWGTVKDHQGYIDVNSLEGKGTTFTIYFPVTREDLTKETSSVSMSELMGNGESILIVDDVKGQRDLATAMLKKLNYTVTSVASGEEAIEYLKQNKADIIVLDMIMDPGMDGLDTYKSILKIKPQQKAIIVSGFSESDRVHDAQALGAGEYVKKPYVQEKLGLAVKKELGKK